MHFQGESAVAAEAHRPGTPYHLLARTAAHRWWRPLVGLLLFPVLAVALMVLLYGAAMVLAFALGVGMDAELGFADPLWNFALGFVSIAVVLPVVLLITRTTQRRPVGTVSSVEGRLRWRWMGYCARWAFLGFVLVTAVDLVLNGWDAASWPGWPTFLAVLAISVAVIPLQAATEEYVCRGWLVQTFASWTRTPWPGAVASSLLFVVLHDYTEPLVVVDLFVFAMAMCWLTIRTGGLEAAIALHVANNLTFALAAAPHGVPSLDQSGSYDLWEILPSTLITVIYTWWIDRRACRIGITSTAPKPVSFEPPPGPPAGYLGTDAA